MIYDFSLIISNTFDLQDKFDLQGDVIDVKKVVDTKLRHQLSSIVQEIPCNEE